jgi:hypothetical protein
MIWKSTTLQINACRSGAFPAMAEEDEDESHHMDTDKTDEEVQDTGPALDDDVVNGVFLPSIALNCLPGCCTRMFSCSGILD